MAKKKRKAVCVMCEHFHFEPGERDYSEVTPGCDASITCYKNHWDVDMKTANNEHFYKLMKTAETCRDYKFRELK